MLHSIVVLTPLRARLVAIGLIAVAALGVAGHSRIPPPLRDRSASIGDVNLQLSTIERLRSGEPYYAAVGDELRKHGYPTSPVFNWRTPLHYRAMAALSVEHAGRLLTGLAMAVVVTGGLAYSRYSLARALVGALLLLAAMAPALLVRPGAVGFPEIWAGALIGLSLNAYVARQWMAGAAAGVLAVFVRELSAPYAVACGLLAIRDRRRHEAWMWITGGLLYGVYYAAHAMAASGSILPGDLVRDASYMRWLGLPFVFKTLYVYGGLTVLPAIFTPVAAACGLAGAWARTAPAQVRASVLLYFALFSIVGQPFNFYWGYLTTAIWAHAFLHAAEGIRVLARAALRPSHQAIDGTRKPGVIGS